MIDPSELSASKIDRTSQIETFDEVRRFWQTPDVEQVLLPCQIDLSVAQVHMLNETGAISSGDAAELIKSLNQIKENIANGEAILLPTDANSQSAILRHLEKLVGSKAELLKTAISKSWTKSDQLDIDLRLWLRGVTTVILSELLDLRQMLVDLAARDNDYVMPGYSNMQPSGQIMLSDWWLANEARFQRDFRRLVEVHGRLNVLPIGALPQAIESQAERRLIANYLGMAQIQDNRLDAISDRDFLIEFTSAASLIGLHISQMSSELLIWSTREFGFFQLPRGFSFRGQNLPPKRNTELLEILRSRPAVIFGRLSQFLTELKGLPLSYGQDLHECLPGLVDISKTMNFLLSLSGQLLPAFKLDKNTMRETASTDQSNAANAQDYLIDRGVDPKRAADIVSHAVTYCKERRRNLVDLTLNEWGLFSPAFDESIYDFVSADESAFSSSSSVSATSNSLGSFVGTGSVQLSLSIEMTKNKLVSDNQVLTTLTAFVSG